MNFDYVNREGLEHFYGNLKTYLSTKYATKEELEAAIANFGGFQVVSLNQQGKPDVAEPSTKIIYLTKEAESSKTDPYTEWICTNTTGPVWEIIGETTPEINEMIGATASTAGTAGLVPAPAAGDQGKVLTGDGNWSEVEEYTDAYIDGLNWMTQLSVRIGNHDYPIVQIGNQLWLAENLDYDWEGLTIGSSATNPSSQSAWYYNNNKSDYGINGTYKCGLLYNQYAADYLETNKSTLLPQGWRVPSKSDIETLKSYVNNDATKLKAKPNSVATNWPGSNWIGNDDYGFSALPIGDRTGNGFWNLGGYGNIWTITQDTGDYWYMLSFDRSNSTVNIPTNRRYSGFAIRLVKDLT